MQPWSDTPVHESFTISFFLDTNILVYLIDKVYPSLNSCIEILGKCPFSNLVSSKFVLIEFVDVRKREHYLRQVTKRATVNGDSEINFSSLIKTKDTFSNPYCDFKEVVGTIGDTVNKEIEKISRDFYINYEYGDFHSDQLWPTIKICLSSKIRQQDSFILVSSVLPNKEKSNHVALMTNDGGFPSSYIEAEIATFMSSELKLVPCDFIQIHDNNHNNIHLTNRKDISPHETIEERIKNVIKNLILEKSSNLHLGNTFTPTSKGIPNDVICFNLLNSKRIKSGVYLTIIGKDLDFIYTSKKPVELLHNGSKLTDVFTSSKGSSYLAYKMIDDEVDNKQEVIENLQKEGNLVFLHPDSPSIPA